MKAPWKLALLAVVLSVALLIGPPNQRDTAEAVPTSITANVGTCASPGAAVTTMFPGNSYCLTTLLSGVMLSQSLNFEATGAEDGGLAHFSCTAIVGLSVLDPCGTPTQSGAYELDYTAVTSAASAVTTTHQADLTMVNCTGPITYTATQAGTPLSQMFSCTPAPVFTKTNSTGDVAGPGEAFTWTLTAENFGFASFASINDDLPAGFIAGTPVVTPGGAATCDVTPGASYNVLCFASSPVPALLTIDIPVTAPSGVCGTFTNMASIFVGGILQGNDDVTVVDPAICPVDTTFTKTSMVGAQEVNSFLYGGAFDWVIDVQTTNQAGTNDYVVTDTIPAGFTIGALPAECSAVGQTVTCTFNDVVGDIDESIVIPVTAPSVCGAYTNTADLSINATPAATADDWVGVVSVGPAGDCNPAFTKSNDTGGVVDSGGSFNWIITAENVVDFSFGLVDDTLPAGFVPGTPVVSPMDAGTCTTEEDGGVWSVSCSFPGPIPYNEITVTIPVTAPSDACGEFTNQASTGFQGPASTNVDTVFVVDLELCPVDVVFTKTSMVGAQEVNSFLPASPFNWVIDVATDGEAGTNDYVVTDTIPTGFTIGMLPAECSAIGQTVTCTYDDVVGDIDESIVIPVTTPSTCDAYTNTASLSINGTPSATADDWVGVVQAISCPTTFTKSNDTGGVVDSGGSFNWIITAENIVNFAFGFVDDTLPAGFVPGTPVVSPMDAGTCTTDEDGGVWSVSCSFPGPIPYNEITVTIPVTAPSDACGEFTNQAITGFQGPASTNVDTVFVVDLELCPVDVVFTKTSMVGAQEVNAFLYGGAFNWVIDVATDGEAGTNDYVVTDTIPAGFTIGVLPAECSAVGQTVTCTFNDVVGDIDESIVIPVTAPSVCGAYTNTADLSINAAPAATADDWVGVVSVGPAGDCNPAFTKSNDTGGAVDAGGSFNWVLTAENVVNFAFGFWEDVLPAGFVPGTPVVSPADAGTCTTDEDGGVWTVECVIPGPIAYNDVTVTIPVTAPADDCGEFSNQANAGFQGPAFTNVDMVTVENCPPAPDPELDKSHEAADDVLDAGEAFVWTLTLTDVDGLVIDIQDVLPAGFELVSASSNDGGVTCVATLATDTVDCDGTATQSTVVITINATAPADSCDTFQNTASGTAGATQVSDSDSVSVENCPPEPGRELAKYTDSSDETVSPKEVFEWYIDVPDTDGYWMVSDNLPPGFKIVGFVEPNANCVELWGTSFTCSGTEGTSSLTIVVKVKASATCGAYTNTAKFRDDPQGSDVTASDEVRVVGCEPTRSRPSRGFPFRR